ncbi:MAG: hypothetical protein NUV48_09865 [Peptococcaceae bacterium]|jgi:tetratricopeptide (TPR) repeat protein|nr:hypothetical protein [Peptococcaceae bacterium]
MKRWFNTGQYPWMEKAGKHWGWLLLAFFSLDAGWLFGSLALWALAEPVPIGLQAVFTVVSLSLGLVAAALYFKKTFSPERPVLSVIPPLLSGALAVSAVVAVIPPAMKGWLYFLARVPGDRPFHSFAAGLSLGAMLFLISTVAVFACFAAITFMAYGIPARRTGRAAAALAAVCLKSFRYFLLLVLGCILAGGLLFGLLRLLESCLANVLPYGFFSRYLTGMLLAGGKTAFAIFLICCTHILLARGQDAFRERLGKPGPGSLWFPLAAGVLTIAFISAGIVPHLDAANRFTDSIQARITRADNLRNLGQGWAASAEYIKAKADLLAFQAYLTGLKEITTQGDLKAAPVLFDRAEEIYPNSPYVPYFKGMLLRLTRPPGELNFDLIKLFEDAAGNPAVIPEARLWTISGLQAAGETARVAEVLNLAIARGVFVDRFAGLWRAGEKRLASYLQEVRRLDALLEERQLYVILHKTEHEKESSILSELLEYAERNPDPETCYQVALIAERIPDPVYMYEYTKKYLAGKARDEGGREDGRQEIQAALFASYMYVKSGHAAEAEQLMESMYRKYPDHGDIACDYVFTLLENRKPARAAEVVGEFMGAAGEQADPRLLYLLAVACLENRDYQAALEAVSSLCQHINALGLDQAAVGAADEFLYRILLEYQYLCGREPEQMKAFLSELEKEKAPALLYHYVMGLEARQRENYGESNQHFEQLLQLNPALAYPYYLLGVNYNEMAGYLKNDCYPMAEKSLLQFLERRPQSIEGYFCLGSVYKHMGDLTRATRAFRKVAEYNPYRDNPLYEPYGLHNHALTELWKNREGEQQ